MNINMVINEKLMLRKENYVVKNRMKNNHGYETYTNANGTCSCPNHIH